MPGRSRCFLLYKPYGVLCQFTGAAGQKTLADFGSLPRDVYPVGRLDADSEGLVLLSNDGRLKHLMLEPRYAHPRTYLVQVERVPDEGALEALRGGVLIEGRQTLPSRVERLEDEPDLPPRDPPVRYRKVVPTAWLRLTLHEGRNRQVRRMTAAVGHPTLRLVRVEIGPLKLGNLLPGESCELTPRDIDELWKFLRVRQGSG